MHTNDGLGSPDPSDPRTYFEDLSHREMLEMLAGANHARVSAAADKLHDVARSIDKIGSDLKTHIADVEWSGEAGDAFRSWGGRVAGATFTLSDYSASAGTQMTHVADVLAEVQRDMPPVPQGAVNTALTYRQSKSLAGPFADAAEGASPTVCMPDPSSTEYRQALTQMESDRTKAVDAMTKLGGAYQGATEVMSKQGEPAFPPPPDEVMPPPEFSSSDRVSNEAIGANVGRGYVRDNVAHEDPGASERRAATTTLDYAGGDPRGRHQEVPEFGDRPTDHPAMPLPISILPKNPESLADGTDIGAPPRGSGGRHSVDLPSDGIQGGRLVEPPTSRIGPVRSPQGTVIGNEELPNAALSPGRYGAGAAPAWERSTEDFTRGGSGLTASGEQEVSEGRSGMPIAAGMGFGGRSDGGRNGSRPGYLVEEEETWTPGDRKVVPSVLE